MSARTARHFRKAFGKKLSRDIGTEFGDTERVDRTNPALAGRRFRLRLLGGFELRDTDGTPRRIESVRAESLIAYLALHPHAGVERQVLAGLLWPDSSEPQARTNLRHLLHTTRSALPDDVLRVSARSLGLASSVMLRSDVAAFRAAVERARTATGSELVEALETASDIYTGEFLPGCFDDWVLAERELLRAVHADVLERLGAAHLERGDPVRAAIQLERLLRTEPLAESVYRLLIRCYAEQGDRARAARVYHACASTLERELGVRPAAETQAAYQRILPAEPFRPNEPAQRAGEPALVGRARERHVLSEAWRSISAGGTRLVLVTGQPGIGKTRLAEGFSGWAARSGAVTATARAHAAEGTLAYAPITAWLRSPGIRRGVDAVGAAQRAELARLLPELDVATPDVLPEEEQRRRMFDAVAQVLLAIERPVLLLADDLHWFDRESLSLLHFLLRAERGGTLMVVATARPECTEPGHPALEVVSGLRALGHVTELELAPLSPDEAATLARRVMGAEATGPDLDDLYAESEGNPLFLVEALRAGWPARRELSPRVRAVIQARLAQLSIGARELLEQAAVIGREFTVDVLAAASGSTDDALLTGLDELWRHHIVRDQDDDTYDFAHDKIREVTVVSVPPPRRRQLHRRVADALARAGSSTPDEICGQIAGHYLRAGAVVDAVPWTLRAADAASRLHAHAEAIAVVARTADALRDLAPTRDRERLELALHTAVACRIGTEEGYTSVRMTETHRRALELVERLCVEPEPPLARSLALTHLCRSEFDAADRFGEMLHAAGERGGDDVLIVEGAYVLGIAAFWQGRFPAARAHFERAIERFRPEQRIAHLLRYGLDTHVVCRSRLANTLWFLGDEPGAIAARDGALALADDGGDEFSVGTAVTFAALLAVEMNDVGELRGCVDRLSRMRSGAAHLLAGEAFTGLVRALDGEYGEGVSLIEAAARRAARQPPVPGVLALFDRLLLFAAEHHGDVAAAVGAARRLLASPCGIWHGTAVAVLGRDGVETAESSATRVERPWNAGSVTLR